MSLYFSQTFLSSSLSGQSKLNKALTGNFHFFWKAVSLVVMTVSASISIAGQTCESIYSFKSKSQSHLAQAYAENLGIKRPQDLSNLPLIRKQIARLQDPWNRYLWNKYSKIWNEEKYFTPRRFEDAVSKSQLILSELKAHQSQLTRNSNDFDQAREPITRWIEKTLLAQGLKSYLENSIYKKPVTLKDQFYFRMQKILDYKAVRFMWHSVAWTLPNKPDKEIPSSLMAKILIDGIDPHFNELSKLYKSSKQSKIEIYRSAQQVVKLLSLTFSAFFTVHHIETMIEQQQLEQKHQLQMELQQMDQGLSEIERMLDAGEFDD